MQSDSIICTNKVFPNKLLAENLAYFWLMHGVSAQKNKQKKTTRKLDKQRTKEETAGLKN